MKPFTTHDFQQAKANHLLFKRQLSASLYNETADQDIRILSQYACTLGQWLYNHALIDHEEIDEVYELEQVHALIHTHSRALLKTYNTGHVEEARRGLPALEQATDRLVELLDTLERKLLPNTPPALNQTTMPGPEILQDFFVHSPVIHCILTGPTHIYSFANPAHDTLVGGRKVLGKPIRDVLPELADQGFFELLDEVYTQSKPYVGREMSIMLANGHGINRQAYLNFIYQPIKNALGQTEGILAYGTDVTEQVAARKKVEESEARFRAIIEEAPVATCLFVGPDMRVDVANDLMLRYWGKGRSVLGQPLIKGVPELVGQPFPDILDTVFTTGKTYEAKAAPVELRLDGVLGTYYFDFTYKPLFNEQGQVYAIIDTAVDVTNQVLAQQQQLQLAAIVEKVPIYVTITSLDGNIQYINPFGQQLLGLTPDEVRTKHLRDFFVEEDMTILGNEALPALLTSHHWEGKLHMRHFQTGELIPFDTTSLALTDPTTGNLEALVAVNRDLRPELLSLAQQDQIMQELRASEERYRRLSAQLEEQVNERTAELAAINEELAATNEELAVTNEELASANEEFAVTNEELEEANQLFSRSNQNLERFAYIASHDLQEPLRKVQQFGDLLSAQYGSQLGEGIMYLERMQAAATRMSTLIRDLLSFSRISTWQDVTALVSLTNVVETVLNDLELRIQETGAIIQVEPLPNIQGDRSQLEQLFQNLLSNALKFRKPNQPPQIHIHYQGISAKDLPPTVKPARQARAYYQVQVSDNGIGFDEKYVDRIFQIFQRLHGKSEFAGTGIGLAICEKVVTNHGGAIIANSEPGQGATFSIYLPVQS
ncbi:ATP-binding protein [Spirosoma linguale]|uniref:histidine kinase n=1 Tax=Spirosoma linguale (strain ATCC 33905 / DSM 74 / LMG 10896 / Claus 1) TaxID=504472 RepID=D2QEM3_SPILD|nr:PAS/PAC sensor signal transduction histidine kinase [Spirosoma linguale DSM 74]